MKNYNMLGKGKTLYKYIGKIVSFCKLIKFNNLSNNNFSNYYLLLNLFATDIY